MKTKFLSDEKTAFADLSFFILGKLYLCLPEVSDLLSYEENNGNNLRASGEVWNRWPGKYLGDGCRYLAYVEAVRILGRGFERDRLCGGRAEQFYLEQTMDIPLGCGVGQERFPVRRGFRRVLFAAIGLLAAVEPVFAD